MSLLKCCFHDVFDNYLSFFAAQNYKIIEDAVVKSVNKTKNNVFLILGMLRILPDIDKSIFLKRGYLIIIKGDRQKVSFGTPFLKRE